MLRLQVLAALLAALYACADNARPMEPVQATAAMEPPASPAAPGAPASPDAGALTPTGLPGDARPTESVARKVHFDGALRLETTVPEDTIEQAVALAQAAGGYVERQEALVCVVAVPVASFQTVFGKTAKLGKILDKTLTAQDITDAYSDTALRKQLMEATLKKLEQLLAAAKTTPERLSLLKEIGDLKGQLERATAELAALAQLANYSKITVVAQAPARHVAEIHPAPIGAFAWIDGLGPDRQLAAGRVKRIDLPVPAGFVALSERPLWEAETATAATLKAERLTNEPRGDTQFWADALKTRLQDRFKVAGVEARGPFRVVHLRDQGTDEWQYDVAVMAQGDALVVAEAYYPNVKDAGRYVVPVGTALAAFDGKGL